MDLRMDKKDFDDLVRLLYNGETGNELQVIEYLMPQARKIAQKIGKFDYDEALSIAYFTLVKCVKEIRKLKNIDNFHSYVSMRMAGEIKNSLKHPHISLWEDIPYNDMNIGFSIQLQELLQEYIRDTLRVEIVKAMMEGYNTNELSKKFDMKPWEISRIKGEFLR